MTGDVDGRKDIPASPIAAWAKSIAVEACRLTDKVRLPTQVPLSILSIKGFTNGCQPLPNLFHYVPAFSSGFGLHYSTQLSFLLIRS